MPTSLEDLKVISSGGGGFLAQFLYNKITKKVKKYEREIENVRYVSVGRNVKKKLRDFVPCVNTLVVYVFYK